VPVDSAVHEEATMSTDRVVDVMSLAPVKVKPTDSVAKVAALMREKDIGVVLVDGGGDMTGVVTDRDLVVRVMADAGSPSTMVSAACTMHPLCLRPDDDVDTALETMRTHAVRRVPVVDNGVAVGVVSLGDLARLRDPESVLGRISTAEPNH
jgi:signal-transduction protein with cAMP-binding, CBS, and nucleotidyltransferase domain